MALAHLPETNPMLPFRDMFPEGLSEIASHNHARTSEALGSSSLRAREYSPEEVGLFVHYMGQVDTHVRTRIHTCARTHMMKQASIVSEKSVLARSASVGKCHGCVCVV